jgi:hypothetical protein
MISCHAGNKDSAWQKIIQHHLNKYPEMEFVDLYKLVYQGTLGPAHLGTDYQTIRAYLNQEMANIEPKKGDMVEPISGDQKYLRINLYAFKEAGGNSDSLAKLVYRSCQKELDGYQKLEKRMRLAGKVLQNYPRKYDYQEYLEYLEKIAKNQYPVPHHSETYIKEYKPAYRVISREIYEAYFNSCFKED